MPRGFNVTDLQPFDGVERNVVHRDFLAHIYRWSFVLGRARMGDTFVDFGCGNGNMLETLYRARYKPGYYVGYDVRGKTVAAANEKFSHCKFPVEFLEADLTDPGIEAAGRESATWSPPPRHVVSFEVVEHVGRQRVPQFLDNFRSFGDADTTYYLSTPNYDERVGAAGNHTYNSGDGRGVAVHEWDHDELNDELREAGFEIVEEFGTFASKRDYWPTLSDADKDLYQRLHRYYDSNVISNIMAPLVPASQARNALRVMKRAA